MTIAPTSSFSASSTNKPTVDTAEVARKAQAAKRGLSESATWDQIAQFDNQQKANELAKTAPRPTTGANKLDIQV